jgi:CBS domain containing-hemolysin-like protein/mannitol/fructose-specific phosphotransferase system IIA component (Ntr-type)
MIFFIYLLVIVLLLLLNAFFVLAEFAVVKARPTQMEALAAKGSLQAKSVQHIQRHLDEYLSVCQVGITLASIGLGFVGEPAFADLFKPVLKSLGIGAATDAAAHGTAITLSYALVSFLHIVIGEQVPKLVAIRKTEKCALFIAYPMRVFRYIFIIPLWLLNSSVNFVLGLLRMSAIKRHPDHSANEILIILGQSQSQGMMSFRRLLYMENVMDMGSLTVRDAMHPRGEARCMRVGAPDSETDAIIAQYRHSRYPLLGANPDKPLGYIHIKDLYQARAAGKPVGDLKAMARPCLSTSENEPLERVLSEMQRTGNHLTLAYDKRGRWTGFITLEDAVEEVIGAVEEEFPLETPIRLSDALTPERVVLDVEGDSILACAHDALKRAAAAADLPMPVGQVMARLAAREKQAPSYVGRRLAIPHARLDGLRRPLVTVARLKTPIAAPVSDETISLLFVLLTPTDAPGIHQKLLSRVAGIFASEFLELRLMAAASPAEVYRAICTAEQVESG